MLNYGSVDSDPIEGRPGEDIFILGQVAEELLLFMRSEVFAWSALDLVGVSRSIIEHSLGIDPSVRPKKQRLRKMSDEKTEAAKAEVHRLLEAKFIEPVAYPTWLSNVVMVQKKSGKWQIGRAHV